MCQDVLVWHVKFEAKAYRPYPDNWRLPQPSKLEPTEGVPRDNGMLSRYVTLDGRRHHIAGFVAPRPFGYKRLSQPVTKKVVRQNRTQLKATVKGAKISREVDA
eukprot:TRINITY_DN4015_c0_g1_i1.p2 TRINITY_DN4015_c0_g1~~TRINITY_DN4015_c0_g1_i1.p2  ORF type:complete len:104 (-),score=6.83 TRINITY_DN4015_c0_g1_i1:371-682(-)